MLGQTATVVGDSRIGSQISLSSYMLGSAATETVLEVNAEAHVYGRTKPGTNLTLGGAPVTLRPDGTFSVRRSLPNGALVIPLLAQTPGQTSVATNGHAKKIPPPAAG